MDPASYCVYNATRNALLSERVVSVSDSQTPSQLLALVLNGPGRDPHFCIRLTKVSVALEIPRLFAFDVAYLDAEQRIVEVAEVGPGTPFPPISDQVASILFLSDHLLPKSGSEIGDFIRICTEAELAALLRAAAHFQQVESPGWPIESHLVSNSPPIPDPFAGSLIFLPASGMPQTTEVFLATQQPGLDTPDSTADEASRAASPVDVFSQIAQVPEESSQLVIDEVQPPHEPENQEPGQSVVPTPPQRPLTRFFETAFQAPPSLDTQREKMEERPASQPSQLPFSLKAVIQFVDDQLRREKKEQEERAHPGELLQLEIEPVNTPIADFMEESELVEPPPILHPPLEAAENLENTEMVPEVSTEDVSEWSRFHATPIGEPEPEEESLPLPQMMAEEIPSLPPSQPYPSILHERIQKPEPVEASAVEPFPGVPPPPAPPLPEHLPNPAEISPPLPAQKPLSPVEASLPPAQEPIRETDRTIAARAREKLPFANRVQRWLAGESISLSGNRRRGERIALPGLVAFYFTGGAPKPHEIVNISTSGLYLRSKELWSPNTLVRMTLERQNAELDEKKSISVLARVVRIDNDGIGHEFVTTEVLKNLRARDFLPQQGTNRKELEKFLAQSR